MSAPPTLTTPRLRLRRWRDEDLPAFATLNADPRVMQHFPARLDRGESDAMAAHIRGHFARHGFGFWAVEVPVVAPFIGMIGLAVPDFDAPFTPCVEIGWRLAPEHWGKGYATEAAAACLDHAFGPLDLPEVVAFTVPANRPSWSVMRRLGMTRDPADDFDHPDVAPGHKLRRHVLYRIARERWLAHRGEKKRPGEAAPPL